MSIVRPHLDYCMLAWRPRYRKDNDQLEKVKRRTTKMVEVLEGYSYSDMTEDTGSHYLGNQVLESGSD